MNPSIINETVMALAVCVPADWTNEQIAEWTNANYKCGTSAGWNVREGVRVDCEQNNKMVHVVIDF